MQVLDCIEFVQAELASRANPAKAPDMQAYMKTDMPFYGVQKPARAEILREMRRRFWPNGREELEELVLALWALPHREEKYLALAVLTRSKHFHDAASLPLCRRLIVEGAWWDFVDEVATQTVRDAVVGQPKEAWAAVDRWIDDPEMWLRRAAIICQVGAKERTDATRLFGFCERRASEKEFFIRKAIGWALREYSRVDPEAVAAFALSHRDSLSGLSYREATRKIAGMR
jgi:3-methyladenine DNA glycosylase AlkD